MKLKKVVALMQNPQGAELVAILVCENCETVNFYRQTLPDKAAHDTAIAQMPCTTCARLAMSCETCGD